MAKKNQKIKFSSLEKTGATYKTIYFSVAELNAMNSSPEYVLDTSSKSLAQREYEEWGSNKIESFTNIIKNNFPPQPIYAILFDKKYHVVDGQHRIKTIASLIEGGKLKITDKLPMFPMIIIQPEKKMGLVEMKKWASEFFIMINTTSVEVHEGTIFKLGIINKSSKYKDNIDLYKTNFFSTTTKSQKESEYTFNAHIIYILNVEIKTYLSSTSLKDDMIAYFSDETSGSDDTHIENHKNFIEKMKELKAHGNIKNLKTKKPDNYILMAFVLLYKSGKIDGFEKDTLMKVLENIAEIREDGNYKSEMKGKRGQDSPLIMARYMFEINKKIKEENEFKKLKFDTEEFNNWIKETVIEDWT